jgi:hypothetical protein
MMAHGAENMQGMVYPSLDIILGAFITSLSGVC